MQATTYGGGIWLVSSTSCMSALRLTILKAMASWSVGIKHSSRMQFGWKRPWPSTMLALAWLILLTITTTSGCIARLATSPPCKSYLAVRPLFSPLVRRNYKRLVMLAIFFGSITATFCRMLKILSDLWVLPFVRLPLNQNTPCCIIENTWPSNNRLPLWRILWRTIIPYYNWLQQLIMIQSDLAIILVSQETLSLRTLCIWEEHYIY